MEIHRYVNGREVSVGELAVLSVTTPELIGAVREAGRRVSGNISRSVTGGKKTVEELSVPGGRTDGMRTVYEG